MGRLHKTKSGKDVGRPLEFTDVVVKKLEEAFSIDASVEEACFYADISRQTYYNNVKEGTPLFDRITALRQRPVLKARQAVVQKLGESYSNAMDYLKRKKKLEFGDNIDVTSDKPIVLQVSKEALDLINAINGKTKDGSS